MRKLYYEDSHIRNFTARVTGCEKSDKGYLISLDATAFYPEGGGQACDLGTLGGARVLDVREKNDEVYHLCDAPLTVGETDDPNFSRITITLNGDEYVRDQLVNQLKKLYNIKQVKVLEPGTSFERELMLIKVKNTPEHRQDIMSVTDIFRGKVVDYSANAVCVEVTGEPSKIDAFVELMNDYGIIEMCRTGIVALERGSSSFLARD